jgi:hypothetical protein
MVANRSGDGSRMVSPEKIESFCAAPSISVLFKQTTSRRQMLAVNVGPESLKCAVQFSK